MYFKKWIKKKTNRTGLECCHAKISFSLIFMRLTYIAYLMWKTTGYAFCKLWRFFLSILSRTGNIMCRKPARPHDRVSPQYAYVSPLSDWLTLYRAICPIGYFANFESDPKSGRTVLHQLNSAHHLQGAMPVRSTRTLIYVVIHLNCFVKRLATPLVFITRQLTRLEFPFSCKLYLYRVNSLLIATTLLGDAITLLCNTEQMSTSCSSV